MTHFDTHQSFDELLARLGCSSTDKKRKIEILVNTKGSISWEQTIRILDNFKVSADRVKIIQLLEQRFERMTCQQCLEILKQFSLSGNDRLMTLECLKRYLIDHQSTAGVEFLLSAFTTEKEKKWAIAIAQTATHHVSDKMAAGGHQGYGATGGLYTQSWPLDTHLYGTMEDQMQRLPGRGPPSLPVQAKSSGHGTGSALYSSHPSYRYPPDRSSYDARPYMTNVAEPENLN